MAQSLNVLKCFLKNEVSGNKNEEKKRVDENLPFGLRIGQRIKMDRTAFILAGGKALQAQFPGPLHKCAGFGKYTREGYPVIRLYLNEIDGNGAAGENSSTSILEVAFEDEQNPSIGNIIHCRVWLPFDKISLKTQEDFHIWLDKIDGRMGYRDFKVVDDEKIEAGGSEEENTFFYDRIKNGPDMIEPDTWTETIYSGPYDNRPTLLRTKAVLYGRNVKNDRVEYLLLTHTENNEEGDCIVIFVGLDVDPVILRGNLS